jgi:glycosyltransferase involved in cell wall biosynthesis
MFTFLHILNEASYGGCEINALNLIMHTANFQHHVLVLNNPGSLSEVFVKNGAVIRHLPINNNAGSIGSFIKREVLICEVNSVIIWHGMVRLPEILTSLRFFEGKVLVHGGNPAHNLPWWVDLRYLLREKWLGKKKEATYVCCSKYVADSFEKSFYLRRFNRSIVYNGVKKLTVSIHKQRRIEFGTAFTLGMTSRLDKIKDHETLLMAFALLLKKWPSARLELVGDGNQRFYLESLAKKLSISENLFFHGTKDDVYSVMQNWDLFVFCTSEIEGFGNSLVEAMYLGLPCIATEIGPLREVGGEHVIYIKPKQPHLLSEAILSLILNFNLREQLSSKSRSRVVNIFSAEKFTQGYINLLN